LVFLDISYPPNFDCFGENGVFQQPLAITLIVLLGRGLCNGPESINYLKSFI